MEYSGLLKDADLQATLNYIQKSDLFLFQRVGIYHYQMNSLANLAVIKISIRCLQFADLYASGSPTCLQDILLIKSPVGLPLSQLVRLFILHRLLHLRNIFLYHLHDNCFGDLWRYMDVFSSHG